MQLVLSLKGNIDKITLENVQCFGDEAQTLLVVFEGGRIRNYPLMHLWYWESHVDDHKINWAPDEDE